MIRDYRFYDYAPDEPTEDDGDDLLPADDTPPPPMTDEEVRDFLGDDVEGWPEGVWGSLWTRGGRPVELWGPGAPRTTEALLAGVEMYTWPADTWGISWSMDGVPVLAHRG